MIIKLLFNTTETMLKDRGLPAKAKKALQKAVCVASSGLKE